MVKHIILWQLKEMDEEEKQTVKKGIKAADVMLDSSFENADALKGYATHSEHVKIADGNVRPYTQNRVCMDYEV